MIIRQVRVLNYFRANPYIFFFKLLSLVVKVEIFLEQREVAFLSPGKICENLNFSTEISTNFAG